MAETYVVICRDDRDGEDSPPGPYVLATRQVFRTPGGADIYASGISPSRQPIVVPGRWHQLRLP